MFSKIQIKKFLQQLTQSLQTQIDRVVHKRRPNLRGEGAVVILDSSNIFLPIKFWKGAIKRGGGGVKNPEKFWTPFMCRFLVKFIAHFFSTNFFEQDL